MSILKPGESLNAKKPIEDLADRLPSSKLNELRTIYEAGQKNDFVGQAKLLDTLRRDVSGDHSNPKIDAASKENLKNALEAIDSLRGNANQRARGMHIDADVAVQPSKTAVPPEIGAQLSKINDIALRNKLSGTQSERVASFLSQVEKCSKIGKFDAIPRFADEFSADMRKEPSADSGQLAICSDKVGAMAKELSQKIKAGVDIQAPTPTRPNDTVEGPATAVKAQPRVSTMGTFLMEKLRAPEADKKPKLGLG